MSKMLPLLGASADTFTPSSIANLQLWLKADSLSLNDGDAVTTWTDSSSAGNNVTQSTTAAKPTFKTSILNGRPVVRFDGGDDLRTASSPTISSQAEFTVFAVASAGASGTTRRICGWTTGGWGLGQTGGIQMSLTTFGVKDYSTGTNDFGSQGTWKIGTWQFNSAYSVLFWMNGASKGTVTGTNNAVASTATFSVGSRGSEYWTSDIAELLVYGSLLSAADRKLVEGYLAGKYAIGVV